MIAIFVCISFGLISASVKGSSLTDYALHFPQHGVSDYVNIWGMPSLTEFTVCMWIQSTDQSRYRTLFSYAAFGSNKDNELVIHDAAQLHLFINAKNRATSLSVNDGNWHHICATWENKAGSWKFYKDGVKRAEGTGFETGHVIRPGGSLTLAQEQDSPGGSFDINQSFQGMITNVNVWDHVLPIAQIEKMSKSCLSGEGNVYKWSDFIHGREGKPRVIIPSPCQP